MKEIEYGLEGAFKFDLYKGKEFVSSTNWFSNFITPRGLLYPTGYSFADCFRFLSLGSDTETNYGSGILYPSGTTGLKTPIVNYGTTLGTLQSGQYIGFRGYAKGENFCGTNVGGVGVDLTRSWQIPTGDPDANGEINIKENGGFLGIKEIMVSPSSGGTEGQYAFSRIVRNLTIPNGHRAVISYNLRILQKNIEATRLIPGAFNTENALVDNDAALIETWDNLSGMYRQTNFGLRCVDINGLTYVPQFGDAMEPYLTSLSNVGWYLSPDNSQFDVSKTGGSQVSEFLAYNADGLMQYIGGSGLEIGNYSLAPNGSEALEGLTQAGSGELYNSVVKIRSASNPELTSLVASLYNIRMGSAASTLTYPRLDNYELKAEDAIQYQTNQTSPNTDSYSISYANPGVIGFSVNPIYTSFGKRIARSSFSTRLPVSLESSNGEAGKTNGYGTRQKRITRKSIFAPQSALGHNTRFGSMVYGLLYSASTAAPGEYKYWPMIDCLFGDSSGQYLLPHYRYVSGFHFIERGTGVLEAKISVNGPNASGSIKKFVHFETVQGGFTSGLSGGIPYHAATGDLLAEEAYGKYAVRIESGYTNPLVSGVTGLNVSGIEYPNGWGAVLGIRVADTAFYDEAHPDLGLAKHSISGGIPTSTGKLYWPYTSIEHELKTNINNVKYWTPEFSGFVFDDANDWISPTQQLIKDIRMHKISDSYQPVDDNEVSGVFSNHAWGISGATGAWILTAKKYNGTTLDSSGILKAGSLFGLTGYIVSKERDTGGKLLGMSWVDSNGSVPTEHGKFFPKYKTSQLGAVGLGVSAVSVISFFSGDLVERGYPNGTGLPLSLGCDSLVFFSGESGSATRLPLYLTFASGNKGYSYVSGEALLTNFCKPLAVLSHREDYPLNPEVYHKRLAVNYAPANYDVSINNYDVVSGGQYPALSRDNGLEIGLDITWSSPCGGALDCV